MSPEREGGEDRQREVREKRDEAWLHQRRQDAIALAGRISDTRLKSVEHVFPEVVAYCAASVAAGGAITPYESEPLLRAMHLKAQASVLEGIQAKKVTRVDERINNFLAMDPHIAAALAKIDRYDPVVEDESPVLGSLEQIAFDKYSSLLEERWLLTGDLDGVGKLMEQKYNAEEQHRRLGHRLVEMEARAGDLTDDERDEYEELLEEQMGALDEKEIGLYEDFRCRRKVRSNERGRLVSEDGNETRIPPATRARGEKLMAKMTGALTGEQKVRFLELDERAGSLTGEEREKLGSLKTSVVEWKKSIDSYEERIEKSVKEGKVNEEWYRAYKATKAMVDMVNMTDQWLKAWHDLHAGGVDTFVQTRWTDFLRSSDMVALLETEGVGRAVERSFRAIAVLATGGAVGDDGRLYQRGEVVPANVTKYDRNILLEKGLKDDDVRGFLRWVSGYAERGDGVNKVYAEFGTEMARMLFESSLLSGWFGLERDPQGNVVYTEVSGFGNDGKPIKINPGSDSRSEAYMMGVPWKAGDGSLYPERPNDYIKLMGTRVKMMTEWERGFPTGLPALVSVLPDNLYIPWISHKDVLAVVEGKRMEDSEGRPYEDSEGNFYPATLRNIFAVKMAESGRWDWAYPIFRATQVYETYISEFVVGLKGFRDLPGELDFFLRSISNLAAMNKKIATSLGFFDQKERQRLVMNMVLALFYAVRADKAIPERGTKSTILPDADMGEVGKLFDTRLDDIKRIIVGSDLMTEEQYDYLVKVRLWEIVPGKGGAPGKGMLKKGEEIFIPEIRTADLLKRPVQIKGIPSDLYDYPVVKKVVGETGMKRRRALVEES